MGRIKRKHEAWWPDWRKLRRKRMVIDSFRCKRCNRYMHSGHLLTVHHIIPRNEGGSDTIDNLISLCNDCHDWVELSGYRTRILIENSLGLEADDMNGATGTYKALGLHRVWIYGYWYGDVDGTKLIDVHKMVPVGWHMEEDTNIDKDAARKRFGLEPVAPLASTRA